VVFDATGNLASMEQGFSFVAPGGRYDLVSVTKGPVSFNDPDFHRKEMSLLSVAGVPLRSTSDALSTPSGRDRWMTASC